MKIEKNDMVMVYDGGGTVPNCKYAGRFGDLTAYWQEIVSDAVYLFRLGESEECDWLVLLGQPWSPYIWSVRFTCLLVCQSAIFIDSRG